MNIVSWCVASFHTISFCHYLNLLILHKFIFAHEIIRFRIQCTKSKYGCDFHVRKNPKFHIINVYRTATKEIKKSSKSCYYLWIAQRNSLKQFRVRMALMEFNQNKWSHHHHFFFFFRYFNWIVNYSKAIIIRYRYCSS